MKLSSLLNKQRLTWLAVSLVVYALLMSVFLPTLLLPKLEKELSKTLRRTVSIGRIDFNPFLFVVTVRDFRVKEKNSPNWVLRFSILRADFELASLWRGGPVVRELSLEQPQIRVTRTGAHQYNFSDLLKAQNTPADQAKGGLPLFSVNNIRISGGRLVFDDKYLQSRQEISDLKVALPFISTLPEMVDDYIEPGISGRLNGRVFALTGKTKPFEDSRETELQFDLDNLNLPDYQAYMPLASDVNLLSGALSAQLKLIFRQGKGQQSLIVKGELGLDNLQLRQGNQAIFSLPALRVAGIALDLAQRQLSIAELVAKEGDIALLRRRDGSFNINHVLKSASAASASQPAAAAPKAPAQSAAAWRVQVKKIALNQFAISLLDQAVSKAVPLRLEHINLGLRELDTQAGALARLQLDARSGKQGRIALHGDLVPQPFRAKWAIDLSQLDLAYSQPYFTKWLNIGLASGYLSAKGDVTLGSQPAFSAQYQGQIGITDWHALDKVSGQDFMKWQTLDLNGIDAQLQPLKVDIAEIALRHFYARLILNSNGRLNLNDILRQGNKATSVTTPQTTPPAPSTVEERSMPPIRIGKVTVGSGNIRYSDNLIRPNFSVHMTDMAGTLSGLSSEEAARAQLDLRGSIDRSAPLKIVGTLNPLAKQRYVDIKANVQGYELTSASTYAAKYAGYGIDKGKLSFDLSYFIEGNKLKASNQLLLDQLTLGAESGSSEATSLPVRFALALLTDRQGQIKINLPIEGTLDDPEFKVGAVIWRVLTNLIQKAVTAPFDLLANLVGGQADLSYIEFKPGQAQVVATDSLEQLAKALEDRPALNLEIAGWVDQEVDRAGLKQRALMQKLQARKVAQIYWWQGVKEQDKQAALSPAEYTRLLAEEFAEAKFDKPRAENASAAALSPAQVQQAMEKRLLASIEITPEMFHRLAMSRAQNAKEALQKLGIRNERLFIVSPQLTPDLSQLQSGAATRVQFLLK